MEETRKRGRPRKRWTDEVEGNLNRMGIKKQAGNGQRPSGMAEECIGRQGPEGTVALERKNVLQAKVQKGL
jgi:hypothetical protein